MQISASSRAASQKRTPTVAIFLHALMNTGSSLSATFQKSAARTKNQCSSLIEHTHARSLFAVHATAKATHFAVHFCRNLVLEVSSLGPLHKYSRALGQTGPATLSSSHAARRTLGHNRFQSARDVGRFIRSCCHLQHFLFTNFCVPPPRRDRISTGAKISLQST